MTTIDRQPNFCSRRWKSQTRRRRFQGALCRRVASWLMASQSGDASIDGANNNDDNRGVRLHAFYRALTQNPIFLRTRTRASVRADVSLDDVRKQRRRRRRR